MNASAIPIETLHAGIRAERAAAGREPRVAHRAPCVLTVMGSVASDCASLPGQTVNLSLGGLAVQLGCPLEQGTRVEVLLSGSGEAATRLVGEVVHSRQVNAGTYQLGIRLGR